MVVSSAWGENETQYFFSLTPEKILDAVEAMGLRCTGRCLSLNSMENRVYEVELEVEDPSLLKSRSEKFRIVKFYRPGRWSQEQILEEHQFLFDLQEAEIPVAAPLSFEGGRTLFKLPDIDIWYAIFPKVGGRILDELNVDQLEQAGRLLARLHNVAASREIEHRVEITPEVYGHQNLRFLLEADLLPLDLRDRYQKAVEKICRIVTPWFEAAEVQRIHGDAHLGNLLWDRDMAFWVDFDDMLRGPCVQDIWLVTPGRDAWSLQEREILLEGYVQMRDFDRSTLRLVEPLRALRCIHFHAWIGKRWDDPAFPKNFPQYGSYAYWQAELINLEDQVQIILKTEDA